MGGCAGELEKIRCVGVDGGHELRGVGVDGEIHCVWGGGSKYRRASIS